MTGGNADFPVNMHQKEQLRDNVVSMMQSQQHLPVQASFINKSKFNKVTPTNNILLLFIIPRWEDQVDSAWEVHIHHINNSSMLQSTVVVVVVGPPTFLQTLKISIFMVLRWSLLLIQLLVKSMKLI